MIVCTVEHVFSGRMAVVVVVTLNSWRAGLNLVIVSLQVAIAPAGRGEVGWLCLEVSMSLSGVVGGTCTACG